MKDISNNSSDAMDQPDEQKYMQPLSHGAYCCDWPVGDTSRCGYKSMKGNVKRHIRVVHFSIRFVSPL